MSAANNETTFGAEAQQEPMFTNKNIQQAVGKLVMRTQTSVPDAGSGEWTTVVPVLQDESIVPADWHDRPM